jgi:carboxymethylenebutenolidase
MVRTPDDWKGPGHRIEPLEVTDAMCPTLAIFGTADAWTPAADVEALRGAWSNRSDCEIILVEGADHGFVHDPDRPVHRPDDAAACWDRAISWIVG